jgi:hypothetical protein
VRQSSINWKQGRDERQQRALRHSESVNLIYNKYKTDQATEQKEFVHTTVREIFRKNHEFKSNAPPLTPERQKVHRKEVRKELKKKQKKEQQRKDKMTSIRANQRKKNSNLEARMKKTQQNLQLFKKLKAQEMMLKQEERRLREQDMLENYKRKKKQDVKFLAISDF